jgi:hypothetical protein
MKTHMKKSLFILAIVSLFISCQDIRTETSEILHEKAVIVTLIYSPSEHKVELKRTAYDNSNVLNGTNGLLDEDDDDNLLNSGIIKTGVDFDGNEGIKIGKNHQITSTTIPEKYGVVFQCKHSTFPIEGSEQKHRILYNKLMHNINDTVDVIYKDV